MRQFFLIEQMREDFRILDRRRTDQHRLPPLLAFADVGNDRCVLLVGCAVNLVIEILADHRHVGRDDHRFQTVNLLKLVGFGVGRASHPGELAVHAEVVLEGDRGQRLVLVLDRHAFLGLHRLVQAVRPAPPRHQAPGKLIDDDDLAVLHDVLLILEEQGVCPQGGVQVMDQQDVGRVVEAATGRQQSDIGQHFLGMLVPGFRQQHLMCLLIHPVITRSVFFLATRQHRCHLVHADV